MFAVIATFFSGIWGKINIQVVMIGIVVLLIGSIVAYFFYSQNKIQDIVSQLTDVKQQNIILQSNLADLKRDQAAIKALTDKLGTDLTAIQDQTTKSIMDILSQDLVTPSKTNSRALETKINKDWKQLQDAISQ